MTLNGGTALKPSPFCYLIWRVVVSTTLVLCVFSACDFDSIAYVLARQVKLYLQSLISPQALCVYIGCLAV